jgi:hypothetical protein
MRALKTDLIAGAVVGALAATAACGASTTSPGAPTRPPAPTVMAAQAVLDRAPPLLPEDSETNPPLSNASAVVAQYYEDITNHDYEAAWELGGSNIAGKTYEDYVAGFSTTASISLRTVSEFGASRVHAVLYATQTDGTVEVYKGTYTVSDGVLVSASIRQTR